MGGNLDVSEFEFYGDVNIVLVGCTGNGKSATGNSILGRKAFPSMSSSGAVTNTCKRGGVVLPDGQFLNVIDTPCLFDSSSDHETIKRELVQCVKMAKAGVHAILMVVSLNVRFSEKQVATVDILKNLFGEKILNYMIVIFTGGDDLKENGSTLNDRLASSTTNALNELLERCGNRMVVFDNKTKDEVKQSEQRHNLLNLVSDTVEKNGGMPYFHELYLPFIKLKRKTAAIVSKIKNHMTTWVDDEEEEKRNLEVKTTEELSRIQREVEMYKLQEELYKSKIETAQKLEERVQKREEQAQYEVNRLREKLDKAQDEVHRLREKLDKAQNDEILRLRKELEAPPAQKSFFESNLLTYRRQLRK